MSSDTIKWHYAIDDERLGPVSEAELAELAEAGTVTGDTLVWRSSMSGWQKLRVAPGAPEGPWSTQTTPPPLTPPPMSPIAQKGSVRAYGRPAPASQAMAIPALNRPKLTLPLPIEPVVDNYGKRESKVAHHVHLYPAIIKRAGQAEGKELLEADESSCYYHPQFAATNMCSHSGRFICDLCSTEFNGEVISLQALNDIKAKGKVAKLDDSRKLWDDIALAFLIVPIFAPVAIGISLWKWKQGPTSIVRKTRARYGVAIGIGVLELLLLAWVFTGGLA